MNGDAIIRRVTNIIVVHVLTKMIVCLVGSNIISKPPERTELLFRLKYTLESFIIFLS